MKDTVMTPEVAARLKSRAVYHSEVRGAAVWHYMIGVGLRNADNGAFWLDTRAPDYVEVDVYTGKEWFGLGGSANDHGGSVQALTHLEKRVRESCSEWQRRVETPLG